MVMMVVVLVAMPMNDDDDGDGGDAGDSDYVNADDEYWNEKDIIDERTKQNKEIGQSTII